jgi:hypothetical protein
MCIHMGVPRAWHTTMSRGDHFLFGLVFIKKK